MARLTLTLCIIALAISSALASLKMTPEKAVLMVPAGGTLELQCIHQYKEGTTPKSLFFTKDNTVLGNIKSKPTVMTETIWTDTYSYKKENVTIADTGNYQCQLQDSGTTSNVQVFVFRLPVLQNVELVKDADSLTLNCGLAEGDSEFLKYKVTWSHNDVALTEGSKYKFVNNSLEIQKPVRADMGEYRCNITFFPDEPSDTHTVRPGAISVFAQAAVDSHDNNKNMVQGDDLELSCTVSGFPQPTVSWYKDGQEVNKTTRVHIKPHKGSDQGKLIIYSLVYEDEAMYSCVAQNEFNNMTYNATGEMRLRVKDKLAALWPFLGIVAEVIILCAIILCYEKSRSKKLNDDDDAPDANVENMQDHGDVRHRRT